jgi:hypothetical protein
MTKAELNDLYGIHRLQCESIIDGLLAKHVQTVIRLLPYMPDLKAKEQIRGIVKIGLATKKCDIGAWRCSASGKGMVLFCEKGSVGCCLQHTECMEEEFLRHCHALQQ